jgi:hypothetical protein
MPPVPKWIADAKIGDPWRRSNVEPTRICTQRYLRYH